MLAVPPSFLSHCQPVMPVAAPFCASYLSSSALSRACFSAARRREAPSLHKLTSQCSSYKKFSVFYIVGTCGGILLELSSVELESQHCWESDVQGSEGRKLWMLTTVRRNTELPAELRLISYYIYFRSILLLLLLFTYVPTYLRTYLLTYLLTHSLTNSMEQSPS